MEHAHPTTGEWMRAARAAAHAHARSLRPTLIVEVPREASPTWRTNITCVYCGAPLELAAAPVPEPVTVVSAIKATWDTVTNAVCSDPTCAHRFDIHMRLRPRAPRRETAIHTRNRNAPAAGLIDTITGTMR